MAMASSTKLLSLVRTITKHMIDDGGFGKLMDKVNITSAGQGWCSAEMIVLHEHQNSGGTLHGGLTATLVDNVSTLALMTTGSGVPGVSVDMHITYTKGAKVGEEVIIDAKTLRVGKRMAFLEVELKKKLSGELVAKGLHTKFVG
ncbi:acyl-coenzyme A thioesterase 13-like [Bacillus rossius redtenbacheri]|uniref:acyl-coenzyme A thioesterase 13-like n=1 Tax=Bacillus rossius redtenbacheri TaxID=93214 RepID=UPI002FDD0F57